MEMMVDFINYILEGIKHLPDNIDGWMERFVVWVAVFYIEAKLVMLKFVYGIVYPIIEQIGISSMIENAWSDVPGDMVSVFTYLKIPEGINIILSAFVTRFILDMMP